MKIQVLVAAMSQSDRSLIEKMNITTDAIVGDQCESNYVETFEQGGHAYTYLHFAERGVGLNRNNTLMRADCDVCLFADDDMVYVDGYDKLVERAFSEIPQADVIIFNLLEAKPTRYVIKRAHRVRWHNYLRYGTARLAARLAPIRLNGICFNQCFGGGTEHSHGEDNLFLTDCLRAGLKIYAYPAYIARLTEERPSSWLGSYDEKYLRDQGVLYRQISRRWYRLLCLQDAVRHKGSYGMGWLGAYRLMTSDAKAEAR